MVSKRLSPQELQLFRENIKPGEKISSLDDSAFSQINPPGGRFLVHGNDSQSPQAKDILGTIYFEGPAMSDTRKFYGYSVFGSGKIVWVPKNQAYELGWHYAEEGEEFPRYMQKFF